MSRARDLADLGGSADAGGLTGRNLIINGAMTVAQRGTSETGVTTAGYRNACDRYRVGGDNGTWTISQDTDAPDGFSNSFKMLLTATETISSTSYWSVEQRIEGFDLQGLAYGTSSAKTVTVSFYVKSNITGTYCLNLYQDDGTKNFPKTYTIDSANTWERKTISFVGDTATALDNDNAKSLRTVFHVVAGSGLTSGTPGTRVAYTDSTWAAGHTAQIDAVNDYWQITGLQLEVGQTATPFEHESYDETLLKCARYYYKFISGESSAYLATGMARNNTSGWVPLWLPAPLRSGLTADLTLTSGGTFRLMEQGTSQTSTGITLGTSFRESILLVVTVASGLAAGDCVVFRHNTANSSFVAIDCEL